MKKLLLAIAALIIIFFGLIIVFPSLFYSFSLGQKIILRFEGDRAAHFYFSKSGSSNDTLYMNGVIYSGTLDDFNKIIESYTGINTLTMVEVPGSIDDEINVQVSRIIRNNQINTYIPENGWVASGGTDMFLAGKERYRHPNTKIGVHSWGGGKKKATEYSRDHKVHVKYLEYYKDIEIDSSFYWYTLEVSPAEKMHWMTEQEIHKYSVISEPDLIDLLEIQKELSSDKHLGRKTGSNQISQDYIIDYFNKIDVEVFDSSLKTDFNFISRGDGKAYSGSNIVRFIEGSKYPDSYIVIGAHYDHMGIMNDSIYNGADDNASGTSALMVLAKYFSKHRPEHSLIFAAFDAEEMGLHGSEFFVNSPPVDLSKIILNINMDMLSYNPNNEIYVVGTYYYPQYKELIESVSHSKDLQVLYGHDNPDNKKLDNWINGSDNGPFFLAGIPNITFSEEDHPYYHQPGDDFKNMHHNYYKDVVNFILAVTKEIDSGTPLTARDPN